MRKLGGDINNLVDKLRGSSDAARVNFRILQVRERYRKAIESVYRDTAQLHLAHTNNVIITKDKVLTVYVDDSLFAAELNAQREVIKLRLLELFGEEVEDFKIRTSQSKRYRDKHPFLADVTSSSSESYSYVQLDSDEESFIADTSSKIPDERIRDSFKRAMTADIKWKKGKRSEK